MHHPERRTFFHMNAGIRVIALLESLNTSPFLESPFLVGENELSHGLAISAKPAWPGGQLEIASLDDTQHSVVMYFSASFGSL